MKEELEKIQEILDCYKRVHFKHKVENIGPDVIKTFLLLVDMKYKLEVEAPVLELHKQFYQQMNEEKNNDK